MVLNKFGGVWFLATPERQNLYKAAVIGSRVRGRWSE